MPDKFTSDKADEFLLVKEGSGTSAIAGPSKLSTGDGTLPVPDESHTD